MNVKNDNIININDEEKCTRYFFASHPRQSKDFAMDLISLKQKNEENDQNITAKDDHISKKPNHAKKNGQS